MKKLINHQLLNRAIIFLLIGFVFFACSKNETPAPTPPVVVINPPGAPTSVSAVAGNALAIISFSAPASNGGAAITGYTVTSSPGNLTSTGLQSPITITGLSNGTAYSFTVIATNSAGIGAASALSNAITPTTTSVPVVVAKTCAVLSISRFNNGAKSDYAMTVFYDYVNRPVRMVLYDSLRKVKDYEASFVYQSDAIKIDQYQSFKIDPTTQQIRTFTTKYDLANPKSDDYVYEYLYNDSGYLTVKNLYINGAKTPTYKTNYVYDNNYLLTGCTMVLASSNLKILESTVTYETTQSVKGFLYNFPDGFESFMYSPIFNYGRKMKYPVKTMVTKLYDPSNNAVLDTWTSSFGSFALTADGYVAQATHAGDLQQGFGLFYGKTVFTYMCQ